MKRQFLSRLAIALCLGVPVPATAGVNDLPLRSIVSVDDEQVILDVFVDSPGVPLRAFGFRASYNPNDLRFASGGRYAGLWFLRGENGVSYSYTDLTTPRLGTVRVVGGRLDGDHPGDGVAGDNLLLATLVFQRLTQNEPEFELALASPPPYVSFATSKGEPVDANVLIEKPVIQPAPEDSDKDGLPDKHEIATYGNLRTSDGDSDTDADGQSDRDEWLRGTDPTDPASKFVLHVIPQADGSKLVVWTSQPGRDYDLQWSRNLRTFTAIMPGLPGVGRELEMQDDLHNPDPEGFYRVMTRFPTLGR